MRNVLLIFIRNPEIGKVKTRLARVLGAAEALRIYLSLLEKTRKTSAETSAERWLFYSDFVPEQDEWPQELFLKKRQEPLEDLGARMEAAFQQAFDAGADKVVIVGSDCPELSPNILQAAFEALDHADFVIGPVFDGGYYLLGMKQMETTLFRDISWSTDRVRAQTLEKIAALNKQCQVLPLLTDIDEASDWTDYLMRLQKD